MDNEAPEPFGVESILKTITDDAELVLHSMIQYRNYQKVIVVSGDGDFHCLIEYLKVQGKLCKILVPDIHNYSRLLNSFASMMMGMNGLVSKVGYKKREA